MGTSLPEISKKEIVKPTKFSSMRSSVPSTSTQNDLINPMVKTSPPKKENIFFRSKNDSPKPAPTPPTKASTSRESALLLKKSNPYKNSGTTLYRRKDSELKDRRLESRRQPFYHQQLKWRHRVQLPSLFRRSWTLAETIRKWKQEREKKAFCKTKISNDCYCP
ncbi:unnamed protein product, partial [Mesorhabditis belari]|uniref:Uncharacterized protein n=1 Tax=Mesorhabditis belari TaxID=2138241 RepID=A0AAF3FJF4_9BILA